MTYATRQDLIDRFGEDELIGLTSRHGALAIDEDVLSRALVDADAEINGYLAGRYSLPLEHVPTILPRLAADIARYRLQEDRVTEAVATRYKDAVAFLRAVAKGEVLLGLDADGQQAPSAGAVPAFSSPGRVFTADSLKGYTS